MVRFVLERLSLVDGLLRAEQADRVDLDGRAGGEPVIGRGTGREVYVQLGRAF